MDFEGTYTFLLSGNTPIVLVQSSQSKSPKRTANFTQEDVHLCISWECVSSDPIIGNEQPSKAYWTRITEHFHDNRTFESDRSKNSLQHRCGTIQKECKKFQGIFEAVEHRHPSGVPYQEHVICRSIVKYFHICNLVNPLFHFDCSYWKHNHLLRWKEERISFASLLAQGEELCQVPSS